MKIDVAFNATRLIFARKRRGWTKTRLARESGVSLKQLMAFEIGALVPREDELASIAGKLCFPVSFFFAEDLDELQAEGVSFRSMSKMTAAQRSTALGAGALALAFNDWIEKRFNLPPNSVPPSLPGEASPEAAAEWLRREWGLGEEPIRNMVHLLEARGVRVFSLAIDAREVDAFSFWRDGVPFVFLNTMKSAEHSRFDAAHELGHLILHRHAAPNGLDAEMQANAFASALLMPRRMMLTNSPRFLGMDELIRYKRSWIVSVAALAYRLHHLKVLSDWHYHVLCKQMSSLGYRKNEPQGAPRETSIVLAKVLAAVRDDGLTKSDIAENLNVNVKDIDELIFGLALTNVSTATVAPAQKARPNLTIVAGRKAHG